MEQGEKRIVTPSGRYAPLVIDFSERDGDKRLREIREEIKAGTFTRWLELVILPLYGTKKGEERAQFVEEVVLFQTELFHEEKISARLPAATLILANKMIDKKRLMKMWEGIKMLDIIEIAREKGIEEGKAIAGAAAVREVLLDLLFERFGVMPKGLQKKIGSVDSLYALKFLSRQAIRCADMEAFEGVLQKALETQNSGDAKGNTPEVH